MNQSYECLFTQFRTTNKYKDIYANREKNVINDFASELHFSMLRDVVIKGASGRRSAWKWDQWWSSSGLGRAFNFDRHHSSAVHRRRPACKNARSGVDRTRWSVREESQCEFFVVKLIALFNFISKYIFTAGNAKLVYSFNISLMYIHLLCWLINHLIVFYELLTLHEYYSNS